MSPTTLVIENAGLSDRGLVRKENEDSWSAAPELGLFIVSDGMGGHLGGAVASRIVAEALPKILRKRMAPIENFADPRAREHLEGALSELSTQVREQGRNEPGLRGMGATVVLVMIKGSEALVAHMGDSRAYQLRGGRFTQLTRDHSVVELLIEEGEITRNGAATHPARGQITCCVGMEGDPLPDVMTLDLELGDRLLLCTDGLTGMLCDEEIQKILESRMGPKDACRRLVDAANEAGGNDNVTAVVLDVGNLENRKERSVVS